ncbi:MAG: hypothetical protein ABGY95_11240, partial [Rubritalea sp.]
DEYFNRDLKSELSKRPSLRGKGKFKEVANREPLEKLIPQVVIPKIGKLSAKDKERQSTKEWKALANKHSAIESNINCLEQHGLNRCPDKGFSAYRRYVGLGVQAYNLHKIGNHILEKWRDAEKKDRSIDRLDSSHGLTPIRIPPRELEAALCSDITKIQDQGSS